MLRYTMNAPGEQAPALSFIKLFTFRLDTLLLLSLNVNQVGTIIINDVISAYYIESTNLIPNFCNENFDILS